MKTIKLIFLITLGLTSIFPIRSEASDFFSYGNGETELFFDNFSTDSNSWSLGTYTKIENGELITEDDPDSAKDRFNSAILDLDFLNNLNLDDADYYLYWSVKAINLDKPDGTDNKTEKSKTFIELDILENDDGEDREIKMAVRPPQKTQNKYHQLYLDPGKDIKHEADVFLDVPKGQLNNGVYEDFRLHVNKIGSDTVEVMPYYWNNTQWQEFNVQSTTPNNAQNAQNPPLQELPMKLSISENMKGENDFESITLRLTDPGYAAFDAFAITRSSNTELGNQVSVPESSSIISLAVFWGLGFLSQTSRKIQVR